jgi:hypothetical protein
VSESDTVLCFGNAASIRPQAVQQPAFTPFDPSDPNFGSTWATPNPTAYALLQQELAHPGTLYLGDMGGVTLPVAPPMQYIQAAGGNTTPPTMQPSYLLPYFPQPWLDGMLTAHAERGYTNFLLDRFDFTRAGLSVAQSVALIQYVQSFGFTVALWGLTTSDATRFSGWSQAQPVLGPMLGALIAAGPTTCERVRFIVAQEADRYLSQAALLDIAANVGPQAIGAGMTCGLHLTDDKYYIGTSPATDLWDGLSASGVKTLYYQANQTDSAGKQAAVLYYARQFLAETDSTLSIVCLENKISLQFYGLASEQDGQRADWELFCAPGVNQIMGIGNGAVLPDGSPISGSFLTRWLAANPLIMPQVPQQ